MSLNIAIIGYQSGFGDDLVSGLEDSGINVNQLFLVSQTAEEDDELSIRFHQKTVYVQPEDSFLWSDAQVVILAEQAKVTVPNEYDGVVIDLRLKGKESNWSLMSPDSTVNANLLCSADDLSALLATIVAPFLDETVIDALNVVVLTPVTYQADKGSEVLAREISQLMNGRPLETTEFGVQQAFNLIPKTESTIVFDELNRLFPKESFTGAVTYIQAPVFFGAMLTVDLHFEDELEADLVKTLLSAIEGIELSGEILTPVTHGSDKTVTFMNYFIEDKKLVNQVRLSLVTDLRKNGRIKTALNVIQQIEANQAELTH